MTIPSVMPGKPTGICLEWSPSEPTKLSTDEWAQYRAGRNHALAGIAAELGIHVAMLEL